MASERILVVDDDPSARTLLVSVLRREGFSVESARTGEDALRALGVRSFELILTDLRMEGYDGMRLLEQTRKRGLETPLVLITAAHEIAVAAMRAGALDVLLKPFDERALLATVGRGVAQGSESRRDTIHRNTLEQLVDQRTGMLRDSISELERSYDTTLEALGDALDLKDTETEGHSRRVTAYTIALARSMGIDHADMKSIKHGAFLHDIGKMAIPDAILLKPGRLNPDELAVMRQHCALGFNIVRKIPFLREAAEIVFSHQEHYDGGGYPRQLHGDEIPLGARIFAVADTLDAITSDRPYRPGSPFASARIEIARCSGTQFDPQVVDAFLGVPVRVWEELRDAIRGQHVAMDRAAKN